MKELMIVVTNSITFFLVVFFTTVWFINLIIEYISSKKLKSTEKQYFREEIRDVSFSEFKDKFKIRYGFYTHITGKYKGGYTKSVLYCLYHYLQENEPTRTFDIVAILKDFKINKSASRIDMIQGSPFSGIKFYASGELFPLVFRTIKIKPEK